MKEQTILPDCMMPSGEPCAGYQQLMKQAIREKSTLGFERTEPATADEVMTLQHLDSTWVTEEDYLALRAERDALKQQYETTVKYWDPVYEILLNERDALRAERDEWKEAATGRHPNPADFRYWEGRYRDERVRAEAAEAKLARAITALEECRDEIDQYVRNEYPLDHPVHQRYRARDFAANPARAALEDITGELDIGDSARQK